LVSDGPGWLAGEEVYTRCYEGGLMQGDFRIGDRTVVPSLNQILHGGAAVHVEPKVMRVLLCLAARRGEVARREELIQEVWSDTFVTDDVLKRVSRTFVRLWETITRSLASSRPFRKSAIG
jgi:DNA-binding response OmpR family regulator